MSQELQVGSDVVAKVGDQGEVTYHRIEETKPVGVAYVEPEKAKTKRDLEMQAGAERVAFQVNELKNRPPRVVSDAERRAEGSNVPVFRPGFAMSDRPNTGLGPLMRRVGGGQVQPSK